MAYGIVHHFAGGTQEQYDASIAAVHPGPDQLPEGQVFHAAGPSQGGWTIVAVHESQESWEKFRDGILLPRLQAGIEGGFGVPLAAFKFAHGGPRIDTAPPALGEHNDEIFAELGYGPKVAAAE